MSPGRSPNSCRARSLAATSFRDVSMTIWATVSTSNASPRMSRRSESSSRIAAKFRSGAADCARDPMRPAFVNTRNDALTAVSAGVRESSVSAFSEEEIAGLVQGEDEARDDALLRLGVEVHQRVAAHQQIDARDRRVLRQVVAPEDHRRARRSLRNANPPFRRLEVPARAALHPGSPPAPLASRWRGAPCSARRRRCRCRRSSRAAGTRRRPAPPRARWPACTPPRRRSSPRSRRGSGCPLPSPEADAGSLPLPRNSTPAGRGRSR